jgi:excisionase family DNA binding protein
MSSSQPTLEDVLREMRSLRQELQHLAPAIAGLVPASLGRAPGRPQQAAVEMCSPTLSRGEVDDVVNGHSNGSGTALLTAEDVAQRLGVKTGWVYEQSRAGRMPTVKLGRYYRYRPEAIERWIAAQEEEA